MVVGRFAPSPSGMLHEGNFATALLSWLAARLIGGQYLLRIDDLDHQRCWPEYSEAAIHELIDFGLDWDSIDYQSHNIAVYDHYFDVLRRSGRIYACECSRNQSDSYDAEGRYRGICRNKKLPLEGNAIRLHCEDVDVLFNDDIMGTVQQNMQRDIGDFVVRRRDGIYAYHLACAIDEHRLAISHILRGADLVNSTPRQLYLIDILGFKRPRYAHGPLLLDESGKKLSKRNRDTRESVLRLHSPAMLLQQIVSCYGLTEETTKNPSDLISCLSIEKFMRALVNKSNKHLT